ncbi:MAG: LysR family transcriptional regulator [Proteobacteria bacterium]|nr:LysR family transcriptional regulator [Pseudomonadota bacterium]
MTLEELRTFLEVIDSGSLVAASRRLHVTPSTVTARLSALEADVGQRLLHRNKSGAELTSAGFKLQRYAELMTQLWRQARHEISLPEGAEGVCNVGLELDLWRGVGERLLEHLRAECPRVAVALWPGEQRQLQRWLGTGLIDVALGYGAQRTGRFESHLLVEEEIVLVSSCLDAWTPPGSDFARRAGYVYVDHGEDFRREHAVAVALDETVAVTLAAADWALEYLRRYGGSGYLPARHARLAAADGRLHEVPGAPRFRRRLYAVANAVVVAQWPWFEALLAQLRRAAA